MPIKYSVTYTVTSNECIVVMDRYRKEVIQVSTWNNCVEPPKYRLLTLVHEVVQYCQWSNITEYINSEQEWYKGSVFLRYCFSLEPQLAQFISFHASVGFFLGGGGEGEVSLQEFLFRKVLTFFLHLNLPGQITKWEKWESL